MKQYLFEENIFKNLEQLNNQLTKYYKWVLYGGWKQDQCTEINSCVWLAKAIKNNLLNNHKNSKLCRFKPRKKVQGFYG